MNSEFITAGGRRQVIAGGLLTLISAFWLLAPLYGQQVSNLTMQPASPSETLFAWTVRARNPQPPDPPVLLRVGDQTVIFLGPHPNVEEVTDSPTPARRGFSWKLAMVDGALTLADYASSRAVARRGGHESWSAFYYGRRPGAARQGLQMAAWLIASQMFARWLDHRGHPRAARVIQDLKIGGESAAVINNEVWLGRH